MIFSLLLFFRINMSREREKKRRGSHSNEFSPNSPKKSLSSLIDKNIKDVSIPIMIPSKEKHIFVIESNSHYVEEYGPGGVKQTENRSISANHNLTDDLLVLSTDLSKFKGKIRRTNRKIFLIDIKFLKTQFPDHKRYFNEMDPVQLLKNVRVFHEIREYISEHKLDGISFFDKIMLFQLSSTDYVNYKIIYNNPIVSSYIEDVLKKHKNSK